MAYEMCNTNRETVKPERVLRFSDSLHSIFDRYYSESWTGSNASFI